MSFEAELRLPGAKPYEYINLVIRGDDAANFDAELSKVNTDLIRKINEIHRAAADIVASRATHTTSIANPDRTSISITEDVPRAVAPTAEELITTELGGKVIEATENVKPWERPKPTPVASLFDN